MQNRINQISEPRMRALAGIAEARCVHHHSAILVCTNLKRFHIQVHVIFCTETPIASTKIKDIVVQNQNLSTKIFLVQNDRKIFIGVMVISF